MMTILMVTDIVCEKARCDDDDSDDSQYDENYDDDSDDDCDDDDDDDDDGMGGDGEEVGPGDLSLPL